jgi:hypothetical protein
MKKLIQYPIYKDATTFTVPTTVTTIAANAFRQCNKLQTIVLNEYIQTIGSGAFSAMGKIAAFEMPIENEWYCTIDGVLYDGTATTLIQYPLSKATAEFIIPNGVKTISTQAFYSCKYITKVTIPASVTSIGATAFQACAKMTEIIVDENNAHYCAVDGVLYTKDITQLLCYPAGKKDTTYVLPATVTTLVNNTFQSVSALTTILVEDGSTTFCAVDGVLYTKDMKTLAYYPAGKTDTSFVVPEGITTIRSTAFHNQYYLTSITLPSTLTSIAKTELGSVSKLTQIIVKKAAGSLANAPWGATKATVVWEP